MVFMTAPVKGYMREFSNFPNDLLPLQRRPCDLPAPRHPLPQGCALWELLSFNETHFLPFASLWALHT